MFLSEPPFTSYDLRFVIAGFPIRVHPMFWLIALLTGSSARLGPEILVWVLVLFVSILVHELGHAFAMRYFGESARVVLYGMGGLAISDYARRGRSPMTQILISAAGPVAGFALAGLVALTIILTGGSFAFDASFPIFWDYSLGKSLKHPTAQLLVWHLLYVNIFWGLVNLLPVFPLDGGQIARQLFVMRNPWQGLQASLWLSIFVAAGLAVWGFSRGSVFMGILFAMLAYESYNALQQMGGGGYRGGW